MKHRGSFRSAASALGVLLYVLSLSPAASAEVLTIGSDPEMTFAEDTVFENASSESTLSMGSGNTWDNDSSEQVTITNADGSFAVKGPRAGIYVPSGKTLTMKAQELTLSSTTDTQLIDDSNWFFTPLQAAGLYAEGGNVTLEGEKGITLQGFNHGLYASGPSDNNDTEFFPMRAMVLMAFGKANFLMTQPIRICPPVESIRMNAPRLPLQQRAATQSQPRQAILCRIKTLTAFQASRPSSVLM